MEEEALLLSTRGDVKSVEILFLERRETHLKSVMALEAPNNSAEGVLFDEEEKWMGPSARVDISHDSPPEEQRRWRESQEPALEQYRN